MSYSAWLPRHKPSQRFNPFRTIDQPASVQAASGDRKRPRYSFKIRYDAKKHDEPAVLRQFQHKAWKHAPDRQELSPTHVTKTKAKPLAHPLAPYEQSVTRKPLLKALDFEHPTVTLNVGSLNKNVSAALTGKASLAHDVVHCIREVVRQANDAKRRFQDVLGAYLERIFDADIQEADRQFLNHVCEKVGPRTAPGTATNDDPEVDGNTKQASFIQSTMVAMISGKDPARSTVAYGFVTRLRALGLMNNNKNQVTGYPASILARSVSSQVHIQLRKHFRDGTLALHQKVRCKRFMCCRNYTTVAINLSNTFLFSSGKHVGGAAEENEGKRPAS